MIPWPLMIAAALIVGLAGMAQSTMGFGYALFASPLLVLLGLPLPGVVTLVATCSMMNALIGARHLDTATPWKVGWTATGIRMISVLLGLFLLRNLAGLNPDTIKLLVGCILCLLVGVQFLFRPHPVPSMHWGWAGLAFIASGLLAGLTGMGGPPLVMWAMAHDWSAPRTRGFLFSVFCTSIPFQLILLTLMFGVGMLWYIAAGVGLLPVILLGSRIGLPIGNRLPKERLRTIAYLILLAIGLSAAGPMLVEMLTE